MIILSKSQWLQDQNTPGIITLSQNGFNEGNKLIQIIFTAEKLLTNSFALSGEYPSRPFSFKFRITFVSRIPEGILLCSRYSVIIKFIKS